MDFTHIYSKKLVCLNLSGKTSPSLERYRFIDVKINADIREETAESKLYKKLKQHIKKGDVTFVVLPKLFAYVPVVITMIYTITELLPHIVYFEESTDPDRLYPRYRSLEQIKFQTQRAALLDTEYSLCKI